jgi:hypothetical protein
MFFWGKETLLALNKINGWLIFPASPGKTQRSSNNYFMGLGRSLQPLNQSEIRLSVSRIIMDKHAVYSIETPYPYLDDSLDIDQSTFASMWALFEKILQHWQLMEPCAGQQSQLLVFMQNRMRVDLNYYADYKNAASVIDELIQEFGDEQAYITLLTDAAANIAPPETRIARARQKVSNEFISLALAMGGFRRFGAKNVPGFIGGANIAGETPYRTYIEARGEQ